MDDEWIEHNGRGCPVPLAMRVDVKWNNGSISPNHKAGDWALRPFDNIDFWTISGRGYITAYRPSAR